MQHYPPATTVAILCTDVFSDDILARLLEREGYSVRRLCVRHLEAHPTGPVDALLEGADVLLLAPGLEDDAREAALGAVRSNPKTAAVPVLPVPAALQQALLDELSAGTSWRGLFEDLTSQIEVALARAAQGATQGASQGARPFAGGDEA